MTGEWRTLRNPPPPPEVRQALHVLLSEAAVLARKGDGAKAITMRKAIDVLRDFVIYEPLDKASEVQ